MDPVRDLALALDPPRVMHLAKLSPDPWQTALLRSDAPRSLLCCARQTGKSTVVGALAMHTAVYRPASLILLLSPSLRQSQELFRKVLDFHRVMGGAAAQESALRLELPNGSRIVALPGSEGSIRGFSGVNLLVIDESSRVPVDLYFACRPFLAVSGGRLICLSTPFGKRGWFYQEWVDGADWNRVRVPATDCPRIPRAFLAEERAHLGEWWYRQEYECSFEESVGQLFREEDIRGMIDPDLQPLFASTAPAAAGSILDHTLTPIIGASSCTSSASTSDKPRTTPQSA